MVGDWFKMSATIDKPVNCEVCAVIHFLLGKTINSKQLVEIYRSSIMSDSKGGKWCCLFKNERMPKNSDRPTVVTDGLMEQVNVKINKLQFQNFIFIFLMFYYFLVSVAKLKHPYREILLQKTV